MKKIFTTIFALTFAFCAFSQDKALLETLVKKGMLTQQEATQIAKESVAVTPHMASTKAIRIFGGMQGWFKWADNSVERGSTDLERISGFELRYVKVGIDADVGHGWTASLVMDFGSGGNNRNYLDKVIISKKVDIDYVNGVLQIGLRKSNMGVEQVTDDFGLLAIDRSAATNFFTQAGNTRTDTSKCFGSRTVGIFWDGEIPQVEGLYYGAAVTSEVTEGTSNVINNINANSGLSYYLSVGYKNVIDLAGDEFKYDIGLNMGYASKGFTSANSKSEVWGVNPYIKLTKGGLTIVAEMFYQNVEDGEMANSSASPLGANFIVAHKFELDNSFGALEPVVRLSYVSADSLGVAVTADRTTCYFNDVTTLYVGLNWYMTDAIKTSIGYEYGWYKNGVSPSNADKLYNNTVLAQLQVVF